MPTTRQRHDLAGRKPSMLPRDLARAGEKLARMGPLLAPLACAGMDEDEERARRLGAEPPPL